MILRKSFCSYKHCPIIITGAVSFLLLLGLHRFIRMLPSTINERPYLDLILRILLFLFFLLLVSSQCFIADQRWKTAIAIGLLSSFLSISILITLKEIPYALNGISGDQGLRTAYITKLANYSAYVDFTYKDLPSFYPPLYYYLLGKSANVLQVQPYLMNKWGLILTSFSLPYITYTLWRMIVNDKMAVVVSYILLLIQIWYKPSGWLSLMMFVPWWLFYVENVSLVNSKINWWWHLFGGAIIGSVIFQIYYYWFFVGGICLLVYFFNNSNSVDQGVKTYIRESFAQLLKKFPVLILTLILSGIYWIPFFMSMYQTGGWEQLQSRDYEISHAAIPLPFLDISVEGIMWFIGFVYLVMTFRKNELSLGLFNFVIAVYVWFILGFLGVLIDKPLMANISYVILLYSLSVAFLFAMKEIFDKKPWERFRIPNGQRGFVVVISTLIIFLGQNMVNALATSELLENAKNTTYPSKQISSFLNMMDNQYLDRVILSDPNYRYLSIYLPTYQFLAWNVYYSHPSAQYMERVEFLVKVSELDNPFLFATAIMNNKYSHIDYIIPETEIGKYRITYNIDTFPNDDWEVKYIWFEPGMFVEKFFYRENRDELFLFKPNYENNPISAIYAFMESGAENGGFGSRAEISQFLNDFDQYIVHLRE